MKFKTLYVVLSVLLVIAPVQVAFGGAKSGEVPAPPVASSAADAGPTDYVVPGKWVVSLDAPLATASRSALARAGVRVEEVSRDGLRAVVTSRAPEPGTESKLGRVKGVDWATPLRMIRAAAYTPNDPIYPMQRSYYQAIGAPVAWDTTTGASSVIIAVIDSGVDLADAEFAGRLTVGRNFINDGAVPQDDNGHGTHVAGIATAAMDNYEGGTGLAPTCSLMPVKVLDHRGLGLNFKIGEGIRWAASHGADVINLSIESSDYDPTLASAVSIAQAADVLVVAAAGNAGGSVGYPAWFPGVVGVSAVDRDTRLASFSNRGGGVDVAAPGVNVWSTALGSEEATLNSGTSMASPFVAGAAALVRSVNPSLTQAEVASLLMASATDTGTPGPDGSFGAGLLNVARALQYAANVTDDKIPGVTAPSSQVTGTLDSATDTDDVLAIFARAGESITATLSAEPADNFGLSLFEPQAQRLQGGPDTPLATAPGGRYPKRLTCVAVETGVHYLDVSAAAGGGDYTLDWSVLPNNPADDDVPGVDLPTSPVKGTLAEALDDDDVYRVYLEPGYSLTATITGAPGSDFDLYLYSQNSVTVKPPSAPQPLISSPSRHLYPKHITWKAKTAGTYFLNPYADHGEGDYTLTWAVVKPAPEADDDVPGLLLSGSPATGTVAADYDPDDVYGLYLDAGQEATMTLTGPASAAVDLDLFLYGPDARHIEPPDSPLDFSYSEGSWEMVALTAPVAGRYFVDVRAFAGTGDYSLSWRRGPVAADNTIPGIAVPASPVRRLLGVAGDTDDVYDIALDEGQQLTASLAATTGADFDLRLFAPDATDIQAAEPVAASYWNGDPEQFTFIAPTTGTYHLNARAASGAGVYQLDYAITSAVASATALEFAARQPVGQIPVSLSATLTTDGGALPLPGARVAFEAEVGGVWKFVDSAMTGVDGSAAVTSAISGALRFRARYSGDPSHIATTSAVSEIAARLASSITLSASSQTPAYLGAVVLSARAVDVLSGEALDSPVRIERLSGTAWVPVVSLTVAPGVLQTTVRLRSATTYRAVFGGTDAHHPSTAASVVVRPKVSLSAPSVPTIVRRESRFITTGSLLPQHEAGSRPVRVLCLRLENGKYVLRRQYYVLVRDYYSGSRYYGSVALYRGTWVMRAYHPLDTQNAATFGPLSRRIVVP